MTRSQIQKGEKDSKSKYSRLKKPSVHGEERTMKIVGERGELEWLRMMMNNVQDKIRSEFDLKCFQLTVTSCFE